MSYIINDFLVQGGGDGSRRFPISDALAPLGEQMARQSHISPSKPKQGARIALTPS